MKVNLSRLVSVCVAFTVLLTTIPTSRSVDAENDNHVNISTADQNFTVGSVPTSTNDDFNYAALISEPPANGLSTQILDTDTTDATVASDDPDMGCGAGVNSNTLWYKIVPSHYGLVRVRTYSTLDPSASSNYDTVLAVFTGQRGYLSLITCNDDASSNRSQSELTFEAEAGQTYYIEVADYGDPGGGVLSLFLNYQMSTSYQVYLSVVLKSYGSLPPQPTPTPTPLSPTPTPTPLSPTATPNPTLPYPSNPGLDCSGSGGVWDCTFSWDSVTGATEYYAEVWTTSGSGAWNSGWTGFTFYITHGMSEQQIYAWRVKARNSAGESVWHPTMCFSLPSAYRNCP